MELFYILTLKLIIWYVMVIFATGLIGGAYGIKRCYTDCSSRSSSWFENMKEIVKWTYSGVCHGIYAPIYIARALHEMKVSLEPKSSLLSPSKNSSLIPTTKNSDTTPYQTYRALLYKKSLSQTSKK